MDIPLETLREAGYVRTETTETREIKRLQAEVDRLRETHKLSIKDWCEEDTDLRETLARVIPQEVIDGDKFAVPPVGDLVEDLVREVERLRGIESGGGYEVGVVCDRDCFRDALIKSDEELIAWREYATSNDCLCLDGTWFDPDGNVIL